MKRISVGSKVCLVIPEGERPQYTPNPGVNPYFPVFGHQGKPIHGIVLDNDSKYTVSWDGPVSNTYPLDSKELWLYEKWEEENEKNMAKEKEIKLKGINVKALNKLILAEDKRRSIVAVLKQYQHADKIFTEWGLGDVIEYGKGMTMLFHGPPGTGKTWAANCIAEAMGKKLNVMDNAKLQSSTPGQMERNIKEAFAEATQKKSILMFDECDSLIMSRSNVGMILGSEINCLLTEIEKFEGVCILTTNRINELDEALERRISLIVKFPKPSVEQREAIWKRFLPKKLPLSKDVILEELVSHEVTGGLIKNIVLNAARAAVAEDREEVCMEDFRAAIKHVNHGQKAFDAPSTTPRTTFQSPNKVIQ